MTKLLWKSLLILTASLGLTATAAAQTSYTVEDLGTLPGDYESSPDLNDAGQVTGWHDGSAFVWEGGKMKDLGGLRRFAYTTAYGINQLTELVGSSMNKNMTSQHAFRFTGSTGFEDLGGRGDENILRRINNKSHSVGWGLAADGNFQALIHTDADGLRGLNAMINSRENWFVRSATDINDEGVIVASAWNESQKEWHAVRLVPTNTARPKRSCVNRCLRSSAIDLKVEIKKDYVNIIGVVTVLDENGNRMRGVEVRANWLSPSGKTSNQISVTDKTGQAHFSVTDKPGAFNLTIDSLAMKRFTFDPENSVLSKSITG